MTDKSTDYQPDNTAIRTALWRALHLQIDAAPAIIEDPIGLQLIAPDNDWQQRPDMLYTKRLRAAIVARARFVDDLVIESIKNGITQYVILGAGLDSFAQRKKETSTRLQIFEIDQKETQNWKQQRLIETGIGIAPNQHFVAVDFEKEDWRQKLLQSCFDHTKPAVVACTGVSLYLSKEAILASLRSMTHLAKGSTIAFTFYLPIHLLDNEDKPMMELSLKGAAASGTPMSSFFPPDEVIAMAVTAGLSKPTIVSTKEMEQLYFLGRTDDLRPASGEYFLLAEV